MTEASPPTSDEQPVAIELTALSGEKILLTVAHIVAVVPTVNGSEVEMVNGSRHRVTESVQAIARSSKIKSTGDW